MNYFQQIYSQYNSLIKYLTSDSYFENYLSIFRVYLSFHILKSLYFNWSSITLLIGNIFEAKELLFFKYNLYALEFLNMPIILLFTIILSLLNLFGVGKYFTSILLFICVQKFKLSYDQNITLLNLFLTSWVVFILISRCVIFYL